MTDEGQADVGPDRSTSDLYRLRFDTRPVLEGMTENALMVEATKILGSTVVPIPGFRAAMIAAATDELRKAAARAGGQLAQAFGAIGIRVPHAPRHPRKGDFDWLTGKPLQGRRYRQACRSYNRQMRYRRIAQRELGGL